ncbi:MAG: transporter related [Proteobacteria bacterium]|nr:transporter related [Pseudomonadota bacterium]
MLVVANITMQFGAKPLFENVSVKFGEGFRYGLIGANGSGKSTFMKIIAGELEASAGNVSKETHERMAYLRQDQFAYEDQRVIDVVMMGHDDMWKCMQEKDAIYADPEATEEQYLHAAELESKFAEFGGYTAEARAGELLLGVGIPSEQHFGPMSEVAPGWKLPQARLRQQNANAKAKERIADLQDFVRRFSANKSKAKQATSRVKLIEKLRPEDVKPSSRQYPWIRFDYDEKEKLHRQAVEIENLTFAYPGSERKIFKDFDFTLNAGDRLAIIGENGVGKTTLLKLLMGELEPQYGTIKWTEKARRGYYAQDHADEFKSNESLTDWISVYAHATASEGDEIETLIRGTLGRLLFSGDDVRKPVRVISGGEQGRMIFGKLMLQKNNVLIMDEPTNHLDMESIESLNTGLEKFKGTLVFVSHDREFVSSLATRIVEIRMDGTVINYPGNYEEYLSSQGID